MSAFKWSVMAAWLLAGAALAQPVAGAATFDRTRAQYSASERVVYLPVRIDYAAAQAVPGDGAGQTFRSFDATAMFRCASHEYALVDRRYFSGPKGSGSVVATTVEPPRDVRWRPVADDPQFARAFGQLQPQCR